MLSDIESTRPVWIVISTTEELAQDGIVPACPMSAIGHVRALRNAQGVEGNEVGRHVRLLDALGLDVPAGEIVLEHADETLFGVVAVLRATGGRGVVRGERTKGGTERRLARRVDLGGT